MTYYKTALDDILEVDDDNERARFFANHQTSANIWFPLRADFTPDLKQLTDEEVFLLLL